MTDDGSMMATAPDLVDDDGWEMPRPLRSPLKPDPATEDVPGGEDPGGEPDDGEAGDEEACDGKPAGPPRPELPWTEIGAWLTRPVWTHLVDEPALARRPRARRQAMANLAWAGVVLIVAAAAARGISVAIGGGTGKGPLYVLLTYTFTLTALKLFRFRLPPSPVIVEHRPATAGITIHPPASSEEKH